MINLRVAGLVNTRPLLGFVALNSAQRLFGQGARSRDLLCFPPRIGTCGADRAIAHFQILGYKQASSSSIDLASSQTTRARRCRAPGGPASQISLARPRTRPRSSTRVERSHRRFRSSLRRRPCTPRPALDPRRSLLVQRSTRRPRLAAPRRCRP
mgnify:CR=1 FL=1